MGISKQSQPTTAVVMMIMHTFIITFLFFFCFCIFLAEHDEQWIVNPHEKLHCLSTQVNFITTSTSKENLAKSKHIWKAPSSGILYHINRSQTKKSWCNQLFTNDATTPSHKLYM